jgi:hypothetical protein
VNAVTETEESEYDGQSDGHLRRRDCDDEEGEDLAIHVARVEPIEGHERQVDRVEHQLDTHELSQEISPREKPHGTYRKQEGCKQNVVIGKGSELIHD